MNEATVNSFNWKRLLGRPLARLHWLFWCGSVGLLAFSMVVLYRDGSGQMLVNGIVAVACIACWANHLYYQPIKGFRVFSRILMGALWDVFFLAIIAIACATVVVLVPPKGHRYLEHEKIHNMLIFGSAYRTMVSESLINTVNLRGIKGLVIEPSEYLGAGIVGTDGQIVLISQRPAAFVVMQPHMKDGQLTWTCGGKPEQLMPPACRDSLTFSVPSSDPVAPKVFDKGGRR